MTKKQSSTRKRKDVLDILSNFKQMLDRKPEVETMFDEVRMMKFKIKPISGDISILHLKNNKLIEILWSLGKLDEIFQKEYRKLTVPQKEVFFRAFDTLYQQLQSQLNTVNLAKEKKTPQTQSSVFEMEIFKESTGIKKVN